jgi:hypothetical protein
MNPTIAVRKADDRRTRILGLSGNDRGFACAINV